MLSLQARIVLPAILIASVSFAPTARGQDSTDASQTSGTLIESTSELDSGSQADAQSSDQTAPTAQLIGGSPSDQSASGDPAPAAPTGGTDGPPDFLNPQQQYRNPSATGGWHWYNPVSWPIMPWNWFGALGAPQPTVVPMAPDPMGGSIIAP